MTKHLHSFGVDSEIAKFANFFCTEKRKYAKLLLLAQARCFLAGVPAEEAAAECAHMDPLGLFGEIAAESSSEDMR